MPASAPAPPQFRASATEFYAWSEASRLRILSGVHKGGFSKGGFSNSCVTIMYVLQTPFTKPPFVNSRCLRTSDTGVHRLDFDHKLDTSI